MVRWSRVAVGVALLSLVACGLPSDGDLALAASAGSVKAVREQLAAGADPNYVSRQVGESAVYSAAADGQLETLRLLLEAGGDVTIPDRDGDGILVGVARRSGSIEVGALVISLGADPCFELNEKWERIRGATTLEELALAAGNDEFAEFAARLVDSCG